MFGLGLPSSTWLQASPEESAVAADTDGRPEQAAAESQFADGRLSLAPGDGRPAVPRSIAALHEQAGKVSLLEVDPDLAADLSSDEMQQALHSLLVPAVRVHRGQLDLRACTNDDRVIGPLIGLLVIHGFVVREMVLGRHVSGQLCGPGDLLDLASARDQRRLPASVTISVPGTTVLALLDDRVLAASRRWPRLGGRLLAQAMRQLGNSGAYQAISQLGRVEDRLLAMFWHLADRFGRVRPTGIRIYLPPNPRIAREAHRSSETDREPRPQNAAGRGVAAPTGRRDMAAHAQFVAASHHGPTRTVSGRRRALALGGDLTI